MLTKVVRVFLLLIVFLLFLPSQVQALGIGVAPNKLELEAYPLGSATGSLEVFNTSNEKSQYQVYVEGERKEWFTITPAEFLLDPGSSQAVKIVVSPSLIASGEYRTSISVVSLQPASELKVGCGVKIPVRIQIIPPPLIAAIGINATGIPLLAIVLITANLFMALIIGILIWRRRKAHES